MAQKRSRASKRTVKMRQRASQAVELVEAGSSLPGISDLLQLYGQHAAIVEKANAYLLPRNRVVIFASSDATA